VKMYKKPKKIMPFLAIIALIAQMLVGFINVKPASASTTCTNPSSSCPTITIAGAPATVISDSATVKDFTYNLNNTSGNAYTGLKWNIMISNAQMSELKSFNYVDGSAATPVAFSLQGNGITGYFLQTLGAVLPNSSNLPVNGTLSVHFQVAFKNLSPTVPESHTVTIFPSSNQSGAMSAFSNTDAVFTVNNPVTIYNANFNVDGVITTVPTAAGAVINVPASPTKAGYIFTGWSPAVPATMPASNQTFVAQWQVKSYNANFNVDGAITTVPTNFGAAIVVPTSPTKVGYTFTGWSPVIPSTMPASDQIFVAQWSVNSYIADFNVDGVITHVATNYGAAIATPANPTKIGYTFMGWAPVVPATMPALNQTFVAQWKINAYTITFDSAGGSTVGPITQDYNTAVTAPVNPIKTGYTFAGWSSVMPTTMPAFDQTLTAQWTVNSYSANFNVDGVITTVPTNFGAVIATPASPIKTGFTFNGWSPIVPSAMPASDQTFTAQWTINSYTITFNTDGGSLITAITQDYNTTVTAPANPTKTGYTFTGWDIAVPTTMPAGDVTLKAKWTINTYTITFNSAGGSFVGPITQDFGTAITAPADPTKSGYAFSGWSSAVPTIMPAFNQTLTAQWTDTQAPAVPTLLSPANGFHRKTSDTNFSQWSSVTDPQGNNPVVYYYQSAYDLAFTNIAYTSPAQASTTISNPGEPEGTYYWRVKACDAVNNCSEWSQSWSIVIDNTAPTIPNHVSPLDGAYLMTSNFNKVDWSDSTDISGLISYFYQSSTSSSVNADGSFASPAYTSSALTNSEIPATGTPEGVYYWHVRVVDALGNSSAWSNPWKVTVDNTAPTANLVFQVPGPSATGFSVQFSEAVNGAEATNPANYFLTNWPGAGGSGDLVGDATISYDENSHIATVSFTNPSWYVSAEQEWGIQGIHDLAGNLMVPSPTSAYSTPLVAPTVPGVPTATSLTTSKTIDWSWAASTDPGGVNASGVKGYYYKLTQGSNVVTDWIFISSTSATIVVANYGTYTLHIYAIDNAGNTSQETTGDVTISKLLPNTITFNTAGGSSVSPIIQDSGSDIVVPADPIKTGFIFTGWSPAIPAKMPASNQTYVAQWTPVIVTVTYSAGLGGTISGLSTQSINYGANTTSVTATPSVGYSFVNWSDGITSESRSDLNVIASKTVTANFSKDATVIPSTTTPVATTTSNPQVLGDQTTTDNQGAVLGDSTTTPVSDNSSAETSDIKSVADTNGDVAKDSVQSLLGIAWYWWLIIAAAVVALGWFIGSALMRRREE